MAYWVVLSIQTAFRNYARFQERAQAALRSELRASQLETQVAQARLSALKAQLQPHFLFNTLNAIVVLVRQQKGQQAEETLARFSDLLRAVLADMDAQEVTLARELEYLKLYLSIEQLRFSDRLHVDIDVDPELARCGRAAHGAAAASSRMPSVMASARAPPRASSKSTRSALSINGRSAARERARRWTRLRRAGRQAAGWAWGSPTRAPVSSSCMARTPSCAPNRTRTAVRW